MSVRTSTVVKFYTKEKELVNKYYLDDCSDDYIYSGLVSAPGVDFIPENFGDYSEAQKEIMKIYFDEESVTVSEGYAAIIPNIQSPEALLPIWKKIRSSAPKYIITKLSSYHNEIIDDYKKIRAIIENNTSEKVPIHFS